MTDEKFSVSRELALACFLLLFLLFCYRHLLGEMENSSLKDTEDSCIQNQDHIEVKVQVTIIRVAVSCLVMCLDTLAGALRLVLLKTFLPSQEDGLEFPAESFPSAQQRDKILFHSEDCRSCSSLCRGTTYYSFNHLSIHIKKAMNLLYGQL